MALNFVIQAAEKRWVPDALIREGIRGLLRRRLREIQTGDESSRFLELLEHLRSAPIALETDAANEQHYEVPSEFFREALGPRLKYSACWYASESSTLADAEVAMLNLVCERAELQNGQSILELGCGWGSFCLYAAEKFPQSMITAVSNSRTQREFIEGEASRRGLSNLRVITANVLSFAPGQSFDRIVSIEMFEHMRNYQELMRRISTWLQPSGLLFVHIFCHREFSYLFEAEGDSNWMGRYFFTGGMMPSQSLLLYFQDHLKIEKTWRVSGLHYARTCRDWLKNMDDRAEVIREIFQRSYGSESEVWIQRWRIFFMSCEELFRFREGNEWMVSHYLFRR